MLDKLSLRLSLTFDLAIRFSHCAILSFSFKTSKIRWWQNNPMSKICCLTVRLGATFYSAKFCTCHMSSNKNLFCTKENNKVTDLRIDNWSTTTLLSHLVSENIDGCLLPLIDFLVSWGQTLSRSASPSFGEWLIRFTLTETYSIFSKWWGILLQQWTDIHKW